MTKFLLVATIASLSIANAGFARAQEAISEPGAYAFYHPDGDVLHAGSGQYGAHVESLGATGVRNSLASVTRLAHGHKQHRAQ
jgi:hypothetical protein